MINTFTLETQHVSKTNRMNVDIKEKPKNMPMQCYRKFNLYCYIVRRKKETKKTINKIDERDNKRCKIFKDPQLLKRESRKT